MNRILLKITFFLIFLVTSSCTYEPIFKEKNYNFEIGEINLIGEKDTNRIIKNKLNLIKEDKNTFKKKYDISINTKKYREIISKNSQGDPLKFELNLNVNYKIEENKKLLINREINKKYIYNNVSDKFKLEQDEKIILENLSEEVSDIIISSIINLNDY
tara:strand:- start:71 stop:547 length:477 start_codon:yes stop_codon:yes gene_type:complete